MNISIYTDAAHNQDNGYTGVGYLIHTEDCYVDMDSVAIDSMPSVAAEAMAIYRAIVNLIDRVNLVPEDTVTIYTDSMKVVRILKGIDKVVGTDRQTFSKTMTMYKKLCSLCTVKLYWVQGHSKEYSQNTLVDRLAKYAIRYTKIASQE